jgi:dipeptidase D
MSYFDKILTIPRPSGKEDLMRKYIIDWSNNFGYEYKVDEVGNIVIYIPATLDQVDKDVIILQAHMDMVCVKGD